MLKPFGLFRPPDEVIAYVVSEAAKRNSDTKTKENSCSDAETKETGIESMIQIFNQTGAVEVMIKGLVALAKEVE